MKSTKGQINTDTAIVSVMEANPPRVFEKNEVMFLCATEPVLAASTASERIYVDNQGFLTTKKSLHSEKSNDVLQLLRKSVNARKASLGMVI
jgi:hypothetical protein